jgi:endonuclease G
VVILGITAYLGVLIYKDLPADTAYYEVRVYEKVDLPANYHVGAKVTVHSRTDGLTHLETVGDDGAAIFRSLKVPTTLTYQLEVISANPPFVTGDNDKIDRLPGLLAIDVAAIPDEKRLPLEQKFIKPTIDVIPRPVNYLLDVDERGDKILQAGNAPWGVPRADLVLNRLGYVLGFDLERKLPRWVAYSIGPTEQRVPRTQKFLADPAIAFDKQASVSDYREPRYDRGHMISPADLFFKGPVTVQEAFYMSTVTPQTPWLNRRLWRDLEVRVREAVQSRQQPAFVIAGPLFIEPKDDPHFEFETIGDGRIPVPTHFFRIMAMTKADQGVETFCLIAPNAKEGKIELSEYIVSIDEIEKKSGLTFFPLLDPQVAAKIKTDLGTLW